MIVPLSVIQFQLLMQLLPVDVPLLSVQCPIHVQFISESFESIEFDWIDLSSGLANQSPWVLLIGPIFCQNFGFAEVKISPNFDFKVNILGLDLMLVF